MSDYIRMLSYIYSYEDGRKKSNVGFAKMDGRNGLVRVFVSIRSGQRNDLRLLNLYFYKDMGEEVIPIEGGKFRLVNGAGELHTQMRAEDIQKSMGLYLVSCDGEDQEKLEYASFFRDEERGLSFFQEKLIDSKEKEEQVPIIEVESISDQENLPNEQNPVSSQNPPNSQNELQLWDMFENPSDTPVPLIIREPFPEFWETLARKYPKCRVLGDDYECIKVRVADLDAFPKKYWKFGNNSFLLHGYYFYHHLLLARRKSENTYYLGVPGYYQKNEQMAAAMFGFQDFVRSKEAGPDGAGYGYWIIQIDQE